MTQEELKKEYDKYDTPIMFDALKEGVESQIVQTEVYKGVYYEIFPYSFQRVGMRKGKPVKLSNRLKSTNNLYFYGFNEKKQIVEVREGCEIENQFDYQFLSYYDVYIKSLAYATYHCHHKNILLPPHQSIQQTVYSLFVGIYSSYRSLYS